MVAAGIYGFAGAPQLGMLWAGLEVPVSFEGVPVGLETQERNLGPLGVKVLKAEGEWPSAVRSMKGEFSLCMGAPPCHGFASTNTSRSGKRGRGPDHEDNVCMAKFAALAVQLGPAVAAFDMVPGFLSAGTPVLRALRKVYGKAGYAMTVVVTQGKDLGLGSSRKRLMVVAHRVRLRVPDVHPAGASTRDWIGDLVSQPLKVGRCEYNVNPSTRQQLWARQKRGVHPPGSAILGRSTVCEHQVSDHSFDELIAIAVERGVRSLRRLPDKVIEKHKRTPRGGRPGWGGVALWAEAAPCVTSGSKIYHPVALRKMTARENARLMSYPDWFCFLGDHEPVLRAGREVQVIRRAYRELAKAVPPLMAMDAAKYLVASIEEGRPLRDGDTERVRIIRRDRFPHEVEEWQL